MHTIQGTKHSHNTMSHPHACLKHKLDWDVKNGPRNCTHNVLLVEMVKHGLFQPKYSVTSSWRGERDYNSGHSMSLVTARHTKIFLVTMAKTAHTHGR